jgi:hypothetical protein
MLHRAGSALQIANFLGIFFLSKPPRLGSALQIADFFRLNCQVRGIYFLSKSPRLACPLETHVDGALNDAFFFNSRKRYEAYILLGIDY